MVEMEIMQILKMTAKLEIFMSTWVTECVKDTASRAMLLVYAYVHLKSVLTCNVVLSHDKVGLKLS